MRWLKELSLCVVGVLDVWDSFLINIICFIVCMLYGSNMAVQRAPAWASDQVAPRQRGDFAKAVISSGGLYCASASPCFIMQTLVLTQLEGAPKFISRKMGGGGGVGVGGGVTKVRSLFSLPPPQLHSSPYVCVPFVMISHQKAAVTSVSICSHRLHVGPAGFWLDPLLSRQ